MKNLFAFIFGGIFSLGLMISGMSDPAKVLSFLDIFGEWDPSLMFVMLGAILVSFIPFQYIKKHSNAKTILGDEFDLPKNNTVDTKLIIGALLFGVGWGVAGICPAPSLTLIGLGYYDALYFIIAMLLGMLLHNLWSKRDA